MRAMFTPDDILYEDNHLLIVNKRCGDLVQPDPSGESALEDQIKGFIKKRDAKPGEVFLGVVHRIDRPVSGAVIFAKTSKALARLNEMIREGRIHKVYWALTEATPDPESGELCHYILRDGKTNRSRAYDAPKGDAKQARLRYATLGAGTNYTLVEVELLTGRHHQIRAQLSKIGCPIRGDLKYGARRSLPGGGISLHSRRVEFEHPVRREPLSVTAPVPAGDNLWTYFEHRIDRPVSGAVIFAKTSKALARLNEMIREGRIHKVYWALTEATPDPESGELCHYILRDGKTNRSRAYDAPKGDAKQARLRYATLGAGTNYTLVEVELLTGRHHQIRAQLSKIGCPIRGDLKYGARRSLPGGGISLHSRRVEFEHPVRREPLSVTAPVPAGDNLWTYFENL